jgi:hypothetical protein
MDTRPNHDLEGLQVALGEGPQHIPHSDKQTVHTHALPVPAASKELRKRKYCGLSNPVCLTLVSLIVAVVIGAAVGGGVAASLVKSKSQT